MGHLVPDGEQGGGQADGRWVRITSGNIEMALGYVDNIDNVQVEGEASKDCTEK